MEEADGAVLERGGLERLREEPEVGEDARGRGRRRMGLWQR